MVAIGEIREDATDTLRTADTGDRAKVLVRLVLKKAIAPAARDMASLRRVRYFARTTYDISGESSKDRFTEFEILFVCTSIREFPAGQLGSNNY